MILLPVKIEASRGVLFCISGGQSSSCTFKTLFKSSLFAAFGAKVTPSSFNCFLPHPFALPKLGSSAFGSVGRTSRFFLSRSGLLWDIDSSGGGDNKNRTKRTSFVLIHQLSSIKRLLL